MVRICYRKANAWFNLKANCRNRNHIWTGKNNNRLGYVEKKLGGAFQHEFYGLRHGKQYKFVVVVFATGGGGKVVDTASGHTPKIKSGYLQGKSLVKPVTTTKKVTNSRKFKMPSIQNK